MTLLLGINQGKETRRTRHQKGQIIPLNQALHKIYYRQLPQGYKIRLKIKKGFKATGLNQKRL